MQPLLVVHIFNKMPDISESIFKCLVFIEINLLDLQGFYKTFSKCIVIRISEKRGSSLNSVGKGITIYHNPRSNKPLCQSVRKNSSG